MNGPLEQENENDFDESEISRHFGISAYASVSQVLRLHSLSYL